MKIRFQVEAERVVKLISGEIYDSPLALFRENIQNAYDAILMRIQADTNFLLSAGRIDVSINGKEIVIADNGIGMDETVVRENFWKAGSSGKRTAAAKEAGVVGTFGIGAMANFGVCESLQVATRGLGQKATIVTRAKREELSLTEDCVEFFETNDLEGPGTVVVANLADDAAVSADDALRYIVPYVQYLPVATYLNGVPVSQKAYADLSRMPWGQPEAIQAVGGISAICQLSLGDGNGPFAAHVSRIVVEGSPVGGEIVWISGRGSTQGLRNYFGLATIPLSSFYNFGGTANLTHLQPTAGREALTRDSISFVNSILIAVESRLSEKISATDFADRTGAFLSWITGTGRYDLSGRVTIDTARSERIELGALAQDAKKARILSYDGSDRSLIAAYAAPGVILVLPASGGSRRKIQFNALRQVGIEAIPDQLTVTRRFVPTELSYPEASLLLRIGFVLTTDYLLEAPDIAFVEMSHGASISISARTHKDVKVLIARSAKELDPLVRCQAESPELFTEFVRDFVRNRLYPEFSRIVPSATKQGADALRKLLERRRELYRYEASELVGVEGLLSEFLSGEKSFGAVVNAASARNPHVQHITRAFVARVEDEIGSLVTVPPPALQDPLLPAPPIMRLESETNAKLLTVSKPVLALNSVSMFLGLSDRVSQQELDFFLQPHTTRVIWGSHRVIFIFSHESGALTFYYDIELKEPLKEPATGGVAIPTTTVITKSRVFVPLPDELVPSFKIAEGGKDLFVRYDYIVGARSG